MPLSRQITNNIFNLVQFELFLQAEVATHAIVHQHKYLPIKSNIKMVCQMSKQTRMKNFQNVNFAYTFTVSITL